MIRALVKASRWKKYTSLASIFTTVDVNAFAYSGSVFCAVGGAGKCATSTDGITWTERTGLATIFGANLCYNIAWNGSVFCAVGAGSKCATSPDGITWTERTGLQSAWGGSFAASKLIWTGSIFFVIYNINYLASSPDGITWTNRSSGLAALFPSSSVTSCNWVVDKILIGLSNGGLASTVDGWGYTNLSAVGLVPTPKSIAYNGSIYVVVGASATTPRLAHTSTDLVNWTYRASFYNEAASNLNYASNVIWTGSEFLCIVSSRLLRSSDGINWSNDSEFYATLNASGTSASLSFVKASSYTGKLHLAGYRGNELVRT